ncbi:MULTISPECIES: hypothetical protein [unclassified Streptomyces]|uniref:hypothetical protein n=1 Tax=unclassified Streptomyces TaxID=2593676 RepID=UPI0033F22BEB
MSAHDDEFDRMVQRLQMTGPEESAAPGPYGYAAPHKAGLTKRGRVALAISATALATGGLLTWQHYDAQASANQAKAAALQLQRDQIALEMQKELNKSTLTTQKTQSAAGKERQQQIDACVENNKGLVGKQLGATLGSVIADCQNQYGGAGTDTMQSAASSRNTTAADGGGSSVSPAVFLGVTALGLGVAFAVRKGTRSDAT